MADKDFSQICQEAKEEVMNDGGPVWQPESDNAYSNESVELGQEQKDAIDRMVSED